MIFALDLEGVLAPEIWPVLGAQYGVPEFSFTTRDIGDFERDIGAARAHRDALHHRAIESQLLLRRCLFC